tara:strand:- start:20 stop:280 length:261 start_codon:yes stop_codon:yes gene_type:complete
MEKKFIIDEFLQEDFVLDHSFIEVNETEDEISYTCPKNIWSVSGLKADKYGLLSLACEHHNQCVENGSYDDCIPLTKAITFKNTKH